MHTAMSHIQLYVKPTNFVDFDDANFMPSGKGLVGKEDATCRKHHMGSLLTPNYTTLLILTMSCFFHHATRLDQGNFHGRVFRSHKVHVSELNPVSLILPTNMLFTNDQYECHDRGLGPYSLLQIRVKKCKLLYLCFMGEIDL